MSNFRPINRHTGFLLPPSVDEWLTQRQLARFVVEVIDGLDLSERVQSYRGSGSASYDPAMLLGLMVYGYSTKVFSRRAIERATHDSVAFRFVPGNEHPDQDTLATFRKRFWPQIHALFCGVLELARTMGMLKLGTVALKGMKVHANASSHSALSYGHAKKIEKQLKKQVQQLLRLAEAAHGVNTPDGMSITEELERRELRLARSPQRRRRSRHGPRSAWSASKRSIKANSPRAPSRRNVPARSRGRPPEPPTGGVHDKDQVNLTDEDSRIMKSPTGALIGVTTPQAVVATGSMLIVATEVTRAANDKRQLLPTIEKLQGLPEEPGRARRKHELEHQANVRPAARLIGSRSGLLFD